MFSEIRYKKKEMRKLREMLSALKITWSLSRTTISLVYNIELDDI